MGRVVEFDILADEVLSLRRQGKKVVLCHGCFDLMHPGHIKHFQEAKRMGDILVVTVTPDKYVDKGSGRPVFNQQLRVESIAALECVDLAAINRWPTAEMTLKAIKPDIYVKGQEFETGQDKTGKVQKEIIVAREVGCKVCFTHEVVFSSTKLLNEHSL